MLFLWGELTAFSALGPSELALRLLPFLAGMGGLLLFWRLAHLTLPPLGRTLAVGFLAVAIWPVSMCTLHQAVLARFVMSSPAAGAGRASGCSGPTGLCWLLVLALVCPVGAFSPPTRPCSWPARSASPCCRPSGSSPAGRPGSVRALQCPAARQLRGQLPARGPDAAGPQYRLGQQFPASRTGSMASRPSAVLDLLAGS